MPHTSAQSVSRSVMLPVLPVLPVLLLVLLVPAGTGAAQSPPAPPVELQIPDLTVTAEDPLILLPPLPPLGPAGPLPPILVPELVLVPVTLAERPVRAAVPGPMLPAARAVLRSVLAAAGPATARGAFDEVRHRLMTLQPVLYASAAGHGNRYLASSP